MSIKNFLNNLTPLDKRQLYVGLGICAASAFFGFFQPKLFFVAYLLGYVFVSGVVFGCMPLHMIHNLTGGKWGLPVKGIWEAAMRTMPFVMFAFLPIALGLPYIYTWTDASVMTGPILAGKTIYLNMPFFLIRVFINFLIWILLIHWLLKWSQAREHSTNRRFVTRLHLLSGLGIVVYALTMTFTSYDWLMSLDPLWFSTMFGPLTMMGAVLLAHAFSIVCAGHLMLRPPVQGVVSIKALHDVGNLLLAFVMLWSYMAFSQFFIIWLGNLPEEIPWYLHRLNPGWKIVGQTLMLLHFAVPFVALLMRAVKRSIRSLALVALGLIVMRFVHLMWLILPEFHESLFKIHLLYFFLPVGMALVWLVVFRSYLRGKELVTSGEASS